MVHSQTKRLVIRYLFMALSVAMMGLIFFFSSQNGTQSSVLSGSVARSLVQTLSKVFSEQTALALVKYIRKMGHVTEYLVLGIFVSVCVFTFDCKREWLYVVLPVAICFFYACTDEFHQLFVEGRAGSFIDVLIDSIGYVFSVLVCSAVRFLCLFHKKKKENAFKESAE